MFSIGLESNSLFNVYEWINIYVYSSFSMMGLVLITVGFYG